jgi:hypothetical protein
MCQNATDCVEIKRGTNVFSYTVHAQTDFAVLLPLALSIFPSPLSVTLLKLRVILCPLYYRIKKSVTHSRLHSVVDSHTLFSTCKCTSFSSMWKHFNIFVLNEFENEWYKWFKLLAYLVPFLLFGRGQRIALQRLCIRTLYVWRRVAASVHCTVQNHGYFVQEVVNLNSLRNFDTNETDEYLISTSGPLGEAGRERGRPNSA